MLISLSVSILTALSDSSRASVIRVDDLIILTDLITASAVSTVFSWEYSSCHTDEVKFFCSLTMMSLTTKMFNSFCSQCRHSTFFIIWICCTVFSCNITTCKRIELVLQRYSKIWELIWKTYWSARTIIFLTESTLLIFSSMTYTENDTINFVKINTSSATYFSHHHIHLEIRIVNVLMLSFRANQKLFFVFISFLFSHWTHMTYMFVAWAIHDTSDCSMIRYQLLKKTHIRVLSQQQIEMLMTDSVLDLSHQIFHCCIYHLSSTC